MMAEEPRHNEPAHRAAWLKKAEETASEPVSWLAAGLHLKVAAGLIWDRVNAFRQRGPIGSVTPDDMRALRALAGYRLLVALALENLAKGGIIAREPHRVERTRLRRWEKQGHNLEWLFAKAEIILTTEERDLLVRLSDAVPWSARYPVPMDFSEFGPRVSVDGKLQWIGGVQADDHAVFEGLWNRIAGPEWENPPTGLVPVVDEAHE